MNIDQLEKLYFNARAVGVLDRHIGARLKSRRILLQMSESWLGDALGLCLGELEAMEGGRLRIGSRRLAFIAVALDVADRYFFLEFKPVDEVLSDRPSWLRDVDCWFRDRVSPHENLFLSVARRLVGSSAVARDLVHDAYAALIVDERWRTVEDPRSYVRQTVVNLSRTFNTRHRIAPLVPFGAEGDGDVEDLSPGPDATAQDRDHLRRVLAALDKLPPKSRRVMVMRKIEGLSGPEIAKCLGISLKGVEIHLTRGMVALNKHLEADDVGIGLGAVVSTKEKRNDTSLAD